MIFKILTFIGYKQTDKQTDRQAKFIYRYTYKYIVILILETVVKHQKPFITHILGNENQFKYQMPHASCTELYLQPLNSRIINEKWSWVKVSAIKYIKLSFYILLRFIYVERFVLFNKHEISYSREKRKK